MEDDEAEHRFDRECVDREAKHVRSIEVKATRHRLEMNPTPHQRKRDRRRQDAAPHDQPVCGAAETASAEDETICSEGEEESSNGFKEVHADEPWRQKHRPAAPPIHPRRRTPEPHRVPVGNAEGREESRERVADQCRIEMIQVARAEDDQTGKNCRRGQAPHRRDPFVW